MKLYLKIIVILIFPLVSISQNIYNPEIDGMKQIKEAIIKAKNENKHVLIQVGGNWCPWCIRFHSFINNVERIDSVIKSSYVYVPLNYSRENKNFEALKFLDYPQRFGFPVLVILDKQGKRIHTQDSSLLEKNNSYDTSKVFNFLINWTPQAINPENYKQQ